MARRKDKQPGEASAAHTANKPLTIYTVDEYGTIHALDCDMPNTNADAFDLDISKADTISGLVELQNQSDFFEGIANQFLHDILYTYCVNLEDGSEEVISEDEHAFYELTSTESYPSLAELIPFEGRMPEDVEFDIIQACKKWLGDSADYEYAMEWDDGRCPTLTAKSFFDCENRALLEGLDVVIVEGDRPGSSYFAAELRGEIEEANAVLARWGCDYRFAVE